MKRNKGWGKKRKMEQKKRKGGRKWKEEREGSNLKGWWR
jgi:hypothetical protein